MVLPVRLPRKMISVLALPCLLLASASWAGPFGVDEVNDTPESLGCVATDPGYYGCLTLPEPHPAMEYYSLQYRPDVGLCMIKGVGYDLAVSSDGAELRQLVDEVAEVIAADFGPGMQVDLLNPDAALKDQQDWMAANAASDRVYGWLWELPEPVHGTASIAVTATAYDAKSGFMVAEFLTPQSAQCDAP